MIKLNSMKKKNKLAYEQKIQIINTIIIVAILGFYAFRLFYYKAKVTQPQDVSGIVTFSEAVTDFTNVDLASDDRIIKNDDGTYTFVGKNVNNYVKYSGILFRIVGVDEEGNVKLVSEESVGLSTLNEVCSFENTSLYAFLNTVEGDDKSGIVENALYKYTAYKSFNGIIGLLTLDEYKDANGQASYLNNGTTFWIMSQDDQGRYYFINENGGVASSYSELLTLPVRFTISIKYSASFVGGTGKEDDPYVLNDVEAKTLADVQTGSYVKYSDRVWRITNNGSVYALDIESQTKTQFGYIDSFSTNRGIVNYLNTTYLSSLKNYEKYLVVAKWNYGSFNDSYTYKDCLKNEYEAYVSLPVLSTLFLDNKEEYFIASVDDFSNEYVYALYNNAIYGVSLEKEVIIKPVVMFNSDIAIVDGTGTLESPYIIEETANEE